MAEKLEKPIGNVQPPAGRINPAMERGKSPQGPRLRPEVFVPALERAVVGDAGEETAVNVIDGVPHPERHDLFQELLTEENLKVVK